jgi:hypothetical protein
VAQLVAVQGAGPHWLLLLQTRSAPHSASSAQSWTPGAAQLASQLAVVPVPSASLLRQQTCPVPQARALAQAAAETVSAGQSLGETAQLKVFMPMAPAVQQVGFGARQKSPPPPQATAPLSARLIGSDGSRPGVFREMLPDPPSVFPPVVALPPAVPGAGVLAPVAVLMLPLPPGVPFEPVPGVMAGSFAESPQAAANAAAANVTSETLDSARKYVMIRSPSLAYELGTRGAPSPWGALVARAAASCHALCSTLSFALVAV